MRPSDPESNPPSSVMESELPIATNGDLKTHSVNAINDLRISTSRKKLSSSSFTSYTSSPDSPLEDPFKDDEIEHHDSITVTTAPTKLDDSAELASINGENEISSNSTAKLEDSNPELPVSTFPLTDSSDNFRLNNTPITTYPTVQAMDRYDESSYRIPSSVFARTKSSTPVDWSVASNESLFSIHMGNMSFRNDHMFLRSGELGVPGEPSTSSTCLHFPSNNPSVSESTRNGKGSERIGVDMIDLRESGEDHGRQNISAATSISRRSNGSAASNKSFAFPILAGDIGKGGSAKISGSVKVGPEQPQPQPHMEPQSPQQLDPKTPSSATHKKALMKWFSCFSCCTSCC